MILEKKQGFCLWPLACKYGIAILLFCSCSSVKYTKMIPGQPLPYYYSLSREEDKQPLINIDTNVIYVYEADLFRNYQSGKAELVHTYKFIKFEGSRIGFYSSSSREPISSINLENIGGSYCYFKVSGDELELEIYDAMAKKFLIWYGKIYADRIHFYREKLKVFTGGTGELDITYYKKPIKYPRRLVWPE
ncbi:hypothetical protein HB364_27670 [Pseudoflavitalea sp. X16]|uniref:hypothetical protein n=1 Tax=Paraflavitalea devenefica TaxID=2716334 RepID=UPI0014224CBA|nr:hypothetical protein [Paraflavitalea devenefica]NII28888.1 hypothetical protein [Paraflavitalea devenefica]